MIKRKVVKGIGKAYVAILLTDENGVATYDDAIYMPGLRQISVNANEETAEMYAEDTVWESENALGAIDVTIDFASIETSTYAKILGKKLAAEGGVIDSADDDPPYIAIMVEKHLSGGVTEYLQLFKGKLKIPQETARTKEGTTEYQTVSLSGRFMPLSNKMWKYNNRTGDDGFEATTWAEKWGKEVIIPTEATTP